MLAIQHAITHTAGSPPPGALVLEDNMDFMREHLRIEEEQAAGDALPPTQPTAPGPAAGGGGGREAADR
jgi:hypothetical protein